MAKTLSSKNRKCCEHRTQLGGRGDLRCWSCVIISDLLQLAFLFQIHNFVVGRFFSFSMKMYSRFPSPIIVLHTKSIKIPVCRLRLVDYLLKHGLAVNEAYLCRGIQYGADYGKVTEYTKISYGSVNSEPDHSSFPHQAFIGFQCGAFVISGLPGDGAFVADFFNYSEFHIFTIQNNFLLILLDFKKKPLHFLIKRGIDQFKSHVLLFY